MKYYLLLFIGLSICSCNQKNTNVPEENPITQLVSSTELCTLMLQLSEDDGKYRKLMHDSDFFFSTLDSLQNAEGITDEEYVKWTDESQLAYGKRARAISNIKYEKHGNKNKTESDSLMKLQIELDNKNTEIFIEVLKQYGYPTDKYNCQKYAGLVARHAQPQYFPELKKLYIAAHERGEIGDGPLAFILSHLEGRRNDIGIMQDSIKKSNKELEIKIDL